MTDNVIRLGTRIHCHAEKRWVREQIRLYGAKAVLGLDLEIGAAIRLVDELPSAYVPIGDCDNRDPDGVCKGHVIRIEERDDDDDDGD